MGIPRAVWCLAALTSGMDLRASGAARTQLDLACSLEALSRFRAGTVQEPQGRRVREPVRTAWRRTRQQLARPSTKWARNQLTRAP